MLSNDAFKLLDAKKCFLHNRFPRLWGERVQKYMTSYQLTQWGLQWPSNPVLFQCWKCAFSCSRGIWSKNCPEYFCHCYFSEGVGGSAGIGACVMLMLWENGRTGQSCSKAGTRWEGRAATLGFKNNWIEHGIGFFFAQNWGGPSQLKALPNN